MSSLQPSWFPLVFFFFFVVEEFYSTQYQSGSFSLINVGSGFHCLRSFPFPQKACLNPCSAVTPLWESAIIAFSPLLAQFQSCAWFYWQDILSE